MQMRNGARRTSIVDSFHEPALCAQVLVDAIQRGLVHTFLAVFRLNFRTQRAYLDVPFIAGPCSFGPPVAFSSPRSSERKDLPANTFAAKERWLSISEFNGCRKRRPINSHRCRCLFFCARVLFPHFR